MAVALALAPYESSPVSVRDLTGALLIVTSAYGPRWGTLHRGTDVGSQDGADIGTPVLAVFGGKIQWVKDDGPYDPRTGANTAGWNIGLLTDDGRLFKYFHLSKAHIRVVAGQRVLPGEIIAGIGNSGTSAAHLHFEEWIAGASVDNTARVQEAIQRSRTPQPPPPPPEDDMPLTDEDKDYFARMEERILTEVSANIKKAQAEDMEADRWTGHFDGEYDKDTGAELVAPGDFLFNSGSITRIDSPEDVPILQKYLGARDAGNQTPLLKGLLKPGD